VALRSKAYVYVLSIAGTAGSNHTEDMDVRLFGLLCVVLVAASETNWSHFWRVVLPVCVCVCVCVCVWSRNPKFEAAYAQFGLERHRNKQLYFAASLNKDFYTAVIIYKSMDVLHDCFFP